MGDKRNQSKIRYSIHDCFMSAFAMMFFQDPSLLSFQERMKRIEEVFSKYFKALQRGKHLETEKINCPVIILPPEQVRNTDGSEKQDCEINAGKRLLHKIRRYHLLTEFF